MQEKILNKRNNGLALAILFILLYFVAVFFIIGGGVFIDSGYGIGGLLFVVGIIYVCIGWIPFMGLKVIKPQEAMVLTLFGKYVGTLKKEGFFFVNPF